MEEEEVIWAVFLVWGEGRLELKLCSEGAEPTLAS